MDIRKLADRILDDVSTERENDSAALKAAEVRQLNDLEMMLAGGGDPTPTWP